MGRARAFVLLVLAVTAATRCGSSSPSSPSTTFAPPTSTPPTGGPPASADLWTLSGRVLTMGSARPVGGARVTSEVGPSTTTTADGSFRLGSDTNPPFTAQRVTIDSPQYMPREVYLNWQRGVREGIAIDLIPLDAPFTVSFYRALVRNGFERPDALEPLRRWTSNPAFYVRAVDQAGRAIEPEVIAFVLATIPRAVSDWTDGRLAVAALESGTETRDGPAGWIVVNITHDPSSTDCARARVGANPGTITLVDDRCGCGSVKIAGSVIVHEIGHALGFWHVGERSAVMYPQASGGCPPGTLSAAERFHAGLAYQRPPGNLDPDRDPRSASYITTAPPAPEVICFRAGPRAASAID